MELLVERKYLKPEYTIGNLYIDGKFYCNTLEDTVRDINKNGTFDCGEFKIAGHTAIPYGEYNVKLTYSPKFKRVLPLIENVPHFEGIRIHRGNSKKDTSGCILVGENREKGKVLNSTKYEESLIKLLTEVSKNNKEKITLKIV